MNKIYMVILLYVGLLGNASASDYFSHSIINIPHEYQAEAPWFRVINTQEDLESFYYETINLYVELGNDVRPMPVIDFNQHTLVVGGLGFQSTGSVVLAIGRVTESLNSIYIEAVKVAPVGCLVTAAVAYPTTGILLNKTDKKVEAYLYESELNCQH